MIKTKNMHNQNCKGPFQLITETTVRRDESKIKYLYKFVKFICKSTFRLLNKY